MAAAASTASGNSVVKRSLPNPMTVKTTDKKRKTDDSTVLTDKKRQEIQDEFGYWIKARRQQNKGCFSIKMLPLGVMRPSKNQSLVVFVPLSQPTRLVTESASTAVGPLAMTGYIELVDFIRLSEYCETVDHARRLLLHKVDMFVKDDEYLDTLVRCTDDCWRHYVMIPLDVALLLITTCWANSLDHWSSTIALLAQALSAIRQFDPTRVIDDSPLLDWRLLSGANDVKWIDQNRIKKWFNLDQTNQAWQQVNCR